MKKFIPGKSYVPASGQVITEDDMNVLHQVVDEGWCTEGKYCEKFGNELLKVTGKKRVILTNSGSSASLLAVSTLAEMGKKVKKYIITTATGFPTTVAPIYQTGLTPIYIDVDLSGFNPLQEQLEKALAIYGDEVAGVIFTHTLGFPFDEEKIRGIIGNLPFIVDACDSLGATDDDNYDSVGSWADIVTLSFFPAHQITSCEGGAVLTDDDEMYEIMRSYANWGRSCYCVPGQANACGKRFAWEDRGELPEGYDHKYIFERLGYNLKMTEFQAGLGYSQIQRLDEFVTARRNNYNYLLNNLFSFREYLQFPTIPPNPSPFGFPIFVLPTREEFTTQELISYLEEHKVRTRRMFGGNLTRQPAFMGLPYATVGSLFTADYIMEDVFWIGCHPALTTEMLNYVIEVFDKFFKERGL